MSDPLQPGPVLFRRGKASRLRWRLFQRAPMPLARWGEWLALRHLRRLGWDVLARNWRSRRGEVDLIAFEGPSLVFVEVKTRFRPQDAFPAEDRVDLNKERKLEELIVDFVSRYELSHMPVRIDVISVETANHRDYELRHFLG